MSTPHPTPGHDATQLLRSQRAGVLSTLSRRLDGYPYGSVTPYVLSAQGELVLYISDLAEHTRNLLADSRASLTVFDPHDLATDPQAGARLCVVLDGRRLHAPDPDDIAERYFRYFPKARSYASAHDFAWHALTPVAARYIGGFGDIHWLQGADLPMGNTLAGQEQALLSHMNGEHRDALALFWRTRAAAPAPEDLCIVGMDGDGMDLLGAAMAVRVPFPEPVAEAGEVRRVLIEMLHELRGTSAT